MSSGSNAADCAGRRPWPQIILSSEEFEVIFQVTHQLPNCPEERLSREGMSPEKVDLLIEIINSLRSLAESSSKVRIQVVDAATVDPLATSTLESASQDAGSEWEAVGRLPESLASVWQSLLKFVVSWLGKRELFLRTGHTLNEVSAAIDALVVRGNAHRDPPFHMDLDS
jgi:hypothetical protein